MKGLKIERYSSLANYTTWRIGGPAEWLAEPTTLDEIKNILEWAIAKKVTCQAIGAGSNLLISDSGVTGLIICTRKLQGSYLDSKTGSIEALAGEPIPTLARRAAKAGLHGLEWAVGIPGTVGGAIVMNAGAQDGCISERVISINAMDLKTKKTILLTKDQLSFGYRKSLLQENSLIVLSAKFLLEPGFNQEELTKKTSLNLSHRIKTQPYTLPSCGSVFRNPEPLKAGEIIEKLGLKGHKIGGAEVSRKHANFIVNTGGAKASDIHNLISHIQACVKEEYGILLHPEVKHLGF